MLKTVFSICLVIVPNGSKGHFLKIKILTLKTTTLKQNPAKLLPYIYVSKKSTWFSRAKMMVLTGLGSFLEAVGENSCP